MDQGLFLQVVCFVSSCELWWTKEVISELYVNLGLVQLVAYPTRVTAAAAAAVVSMRFPSFFILILCQSYTGGHSAKQCESGDPE